MLNMFKWMLFPPAAPEEPRRWVVVDTETTGLDVGRDRLLSIGGVAVTDGRIDIGDSFEVFVHDAAPLDRDNVLIHGIGQAQREAGEPPLQALKAFWQWCGDSVLVGYHAEFDRRMLAHAGQRAGLPMDRRIWLDVEPLAESCVSRGGGSRRSLDYWLAHYHIEVMDRHAAAADALATAALLIRLMPMLDPEQRHSHRALRARVQRYLRNAVPAGGGA